MSDDRPKSAFEPAMERLRQKDKEASIDDRPQAQPGTLTKPAKYVTGNSQAIVKGGVFVKRAL